MMQILGARQLESLVFALSFLASRVLVALLVRPLLRANKIVQDLRKPRGEVLYLENFPVENAGYHYRAKVWADLLDTRGSPARVLTLVRNKAAWESLVHSHFKVFLILALWVRVAHLFHVPRYRAVVVRRELLLFNEYGSLFLDRLLLRLHPNVVLDLDDDLGASKNEPRAVDTLIGRLLGETGTKFRDSLRLYQRFIVGSQYLAQLVRGVNPQADVLVVPTCFLVGGEARPTPTHAPDVPLTLGWIGMTSNLHLLERLVPILNRLAGKHRFRLLVVSGKPLIPAPEARFEIEYVPWGLEQDMANILRMDVGLMPLNDDPFSRGKCGFKLVQYMSMGVPAVGKAVTVNRDIISSREVGWLVEDDLEWEGVLDSVLTLTRGELRQVGDAARDHMMSQYSFLAHLGRLAAFLNIGSGTGDPPEQVGVDGREE